MQNKLEQLISSTYIGKCYVSQSNKVLLLQNTTGDITLYRVAHKNVPIFLWP